ncbi:MAG: di-trans,poly-cis-decaprenylcistransferase [Sulfuricurvum sp.]|nr:di-trans,poly-cis-decaprenylcistransferase [Sulfuricurvum sp.]
MKFSCQHIGIIMDGNGRWAQARGKNRSFGHEAGAVKVREMTRVCSNLGIRYLTLYAFSTENWKRPALEVSFLMKLMIKYLKNELPLLIENNVRFETIGDLSPFSSALRKQIQITKDATAHHIGLTQVLALNYGAHDEIVRAIQRLNEAKIPLNAEAIERHLDTAPFGTIDMIIRTGGDTRLSNFLLWQAAYSELFFTPTLWPDFSAEELEGMLEDFEQRERRFGGLNS